MRGVCWIVLGFEVMIEKMGGELKYCNSIGVYYISERRLGVYSISAEASSIPCE